MVRFISMPRRKTQKKIEVSGSSVLMELRVCANKGCEVEFWVKADSSHSIFSAKCWEFLHNRPFWRQPMPPVRKLGEPHPEPLPKNKGLRSGMAQANELYWAEAQAKKRARSKQGAKS